MIAVADYDSIAVGDSERICRRITEADVRRFVDMTGDDNPLHVDPGFAAATSFKDVVVHGMLGASFISTVIGTRLPGPGALWVSQSLEFLLPVRLGDELVITCTVTQKHDRERLLELATEITNQHRQRVVSGTGKVKVLSRVEAVPEAVDVPRAALVTGGAGGIGAAISHVLAAHGTAVAVHHHRSDDRARRLVQEIAASGGTAVAIKADLASPGEASALVESTVSHLGGLSVIVHNASPRIAAAPLASMRWAYVEEQINLQVRAGFELVQASVPHLAKGSRIVFITSQVVEGPPTPGWGAYAIAKSAITTMARYLAAELGPSGITVNCVAPGMTDTGFIGDIPEKAQLMAARSTPLRRLAAAGDIAAAVAYLTGPGGAHVTGQTIAVNGGAVMR
jgi:3-oxoacyl-[acyl-carrier protein] reductase